MASETGVLDIPPENVAHKGRLQPGRMFLVDTALGPDRAGRGDQGGDRGAPAVSRHGSTKVWSRSSRCPSRRSAPAIAMLRGRRAAQAAAGVRLHDRGSENDPRADGGERAGAGRLDGHRHAAGGAVGQVAAALQLLQATVRAGDQSADRSDSRRDGDLGRDDDRRRAESVRGDAGALPPASDSSSPILTNEELEQNQAARREPGLRTITLLDAVPRRATARRDCAPRSTRLCREASDAIDHGYTIIVLSDRGVNARACARFRACSRPAPCIII